MIAPGPAQAWLAWGWLAALVFHLTRLWVDIGWPSVISTASWDVQLVAIPTVALVLVAGSAHILFVAPVFLGLGKRAAVRLDDDMTLVDTA